MLRKIISIKNVGRFLNYSASGNIELKRYNLIFAENGRGKTTLCAILRSLQSGDPVHVLGRRTLGTDDAPEIRVLLDDGTAIFSKGTWTTTVPDLAIFDSTFVSENVYSGDIVSLDHKRNLYRVIVGKQGVALAREIEDLDTASRTKSAEIRERLATVQAFVPPGLAIDVFLNLPEDPAIDAKIAEKQSELQAAKEASRIKTRAALSELTLPVFPAGFEGLLAKTIDGIAADAERMVAEQIQTHEMHARGEAWLSEGLGYLKNEGCPFCGQPLDGAAALIGAYRAYFSEAYNGLRTEILALRAELESRLGDREIAGIEKLLDQNTAGVEFWSRYCEIVSPDLGGAEATIGEVLRTLRTSAVALVDRKAATPLEAVVLDPSFQAARETFDRIRTAVASYNQAARDANTIIAAKKVTAATADVGAIESALVRLRATKTRHEATPSAACGAYRLAQEEKKALEDKKDAVKKKLDNYAKTEMHWYEKTINELLGDFSAGFRLTGSKPAYPGGVASSSFQILINDTAVDLGDENTPLDSPSFRNTLSSGDKSTLALAFFLAQLDHDPDKAAKIVVFDDPFSSQDSFRRRFSVQKILKCGEACTQVAVLSHEMGFLKLLWDDPACRADMRKAITLLRVGLCDTTVAEWDIEQAAQGQLQADLQKLVRYHQKAEGQPLDVATRIRPVLETHCRNLYPSQFTSADTLGTIISTVRAAGPAHQLAPLLDELEALNAYTTPFAHGQQGATAVPIDSNELHGFVQKTLTITGGC